MIIFGNVATFQKPNSICGNIGIATAAGGTTATVCSEFTYRYPST